MKRLLERWNHYVEEVNEAELLNEVGMYHDPSTGRWSSRKAGAVKSLTKAGAKRAGVDPKHVERGVVTGGDKIQAKMGANFSKSTSCGRMTIDGDPITPKYKCGDYKKPYAQEGIDITEFPGLLDSQQIEMKAVLEALLESGQEIEEQQGCDCSKYRKKWIQDTLRSINAFALAGKAELLPKTESAEQPEDKTHYQGSPIQKDKERKTDKRKAGDRRRKMRAQTGMNVQAFSRGEKELLTPNSLYEAPSSNPIRHIGKDVHHSTKVISTKKLRVKE